MRLLIVGCPHSGTLFTKQVLLAAGVAAGHESIYTLQGYEAGRVGEVKVEVSWVAALHLGTPDVPRVVIAHQTRDPLAWLNSWIRGAARHGAAWPRLERSYPGFGARHDLDPVRASMWLWVELNRRCEPHASRRYRVEDLSGDRGVKILRKLTKDAGIKLDRKLARGALNAADKRAHHHAGDSSYVPKEWKTLPRGAELDGFRQLAEAYGYETRDA